MLFKLKEISEGKSGAAAILTPTEAASLAKVKAEWARGLKRVAESKPVPSARVVRFEDAPGLAKIKAAMISAGSDPKAREILDEMRLKGFAE